MNLLTRRLCAYALAPALLVGMMGFAVAAESAQESKSPETPQIIAVKFHADWCGFCKAMGSVFEELQAKFDTQPVLYVTLDQTREFNRRQSTFLAHALGLDCLWSEHGGKTGFILLIDGKTREAVAKLTHEQNLKQMGAALVEAVGKASVTKPQSTN